MNKKILLNILTLALIGAGVFLSCDPELISPTVTSSVSANVNGDVVSSVSIDANLFTINEDSTLEISATLEEGSVLEFAIKQPQSGLVYEFTTVGENAVSMIFKKSSAGITLSENTSSGSLEIISYDLTTRRISASFSFVTDQSQITNGEIESVNF